MLRGEIVEQIDQVATSVDLVANRGIRKGEPDRAGVISALVALVLEDARLLERLRLRVAPQVQEIREREQAKAERRQRSGGRVGRPPASTTLVDAHAEGCPRRSSQRRLCTCGWAGADETKATRER